jgi:hypothetical protein
VEPQPPAWPGPTELNTTSERKKGASSSDVGGRPAVQWAWLGLMDVVDTAVRRGLRCFL